MGSLKSNKLNFVYIFLLVLLLLSLVKVQTLFQKDGPSIQVSSILPYSDTLHVLCSRNLTTSYPYDAIFADDVFLINQIYQGLVKLDDHLLETPDLAEYWSIDSTKTVYTFFLKKGVSFHNGKPCTAEDVVASLEYFLKNRPESYIRPYFKVLKGIDEFWNGKTPHVAGIQKISSYQIEFRLKHSYIPFLKLLSLPEAKILPASILKKNPQSLKQKPVGTGPYFMKNRSDRSILLEASKWEQMKPDEKPVKYFQLWVNDAAIRKRLTSNRFDLTYSYVYGFDDSTGQYNTIRLSSIASTFMGMNCQKFPTDNKNFRKAITYAIDRNKILYKYNNLANPINFFCPLNLPRNPLGYPSLEYNPKKAKTYLNFALNEINSDSMPTISIVADTTSMRKTMLDIITSYLDSLALPYKIHYYSDYSWEDEKKLFRENNIFFIGWYMDIPDPEFYFDVFFNSRQSTNLTQYSNPLIDSLLEESHENSQLSSRFQSYVEVEKILMDDAPIIPLLNEMDILVYRSTLKDVIMNRIGIVGLDLSRIRVTEDKPFASKDN